MKKTVTVLATALLTTSGAVALGASPALAAAPSCIRTVPENVNSVTVYNQCPQGAGYWLYVVWNAAPDSDCFWLQSGQSKFVHQGSYPFISYNRTELC